MKKLICLLFGHDWLVDRETLYFKRCERCGKSGNTLDKETSYKPTKRRGEAYDHCTTK